LYDYKNGAFARGDTLPILLLNMCTNYVGQIGILLPFGAIGFLILLKYNKNIDDTILK